MRRKKVFVVDDEIVLVMSLESMLAELGYDVAGSATALDEGVRKAGALEADVAIIDMSLAGQTSHPIIEVLMRRNIPVVASSGYDLAEMRGKDGWSKHVMLQKPYTLSQLDVAVKAALDGGTSGESGASS